MMGYTHIVIGAAGAVGLAASAGYTTPDAYILASSFGALGGAALDIDVKNHFSNPTMTDALRSMLACVGLIVIGAVLDIALKTSAETESEIEILENKFRDLRVTITNELKSSFKAIDARLNSMINELRDAKRMASNQFKFKSNEILYAEIDKGIDDDEFSDTIKKVFETQSRNSIDLFNLKLKNLGEIYAKDVADINNKYQK